MFKIQEREWKTEREEVSKGCKRGCIRVQLKRIGLKQGERILMRIGERNRNWVKMKVWGLHAGGVGEIKGFFLNINLFSRGLYQTTYKPQRLLFIQRPMHSSPQSLSLSPDFEVGIIELIISMAGQERKKKKNKLSFLPILK